jgi:hypothetical protein
MIAKPNVPKHRRAQVRTIGFQIATRRQLLVTSSTAAVPPSSTMEIGPPNDKYSN